MKTMTIAVAATAILLSAFASGEALAASPESRCKACHTFDKGGKAKVGPNLFGVVGRKAGSTDFEKYSASLKGGNWVWSKENLKAWVCDSKEAIKKLSGDDAARTKMPKQGQCGDKADEVVAFLATLK